MKIGGYGLMLAAGLRAFGISVPVTSLTALGVLALGTAKFLGAAGEESRPRRRLPQISADRQRLLNLYLPTIMYMLRQADASLTAHERFESEVGGGSPSAFGNWLLSGLKAAAHWIPIALLAMTAGAVLVSPLKLVSGGLDIAQTETGRWLIRQNWPRLS